MIDAYGWSDTLVYLGIAMLALPLSWRSRLPEIRREQQGGDWPRCSSRSAARSARRFGHRSFVLLTSGFFVCGFQIAFITAHFPAYIRDIGIEARYAVIALALIGFFNIIGSLASARSASVIPSRSSWR